MRMLQTYWKLHKDKYKSIQGSLAENALDNGFSRNFVKEREAEYRTLYKKKKKSSSLSSSKEMIVLCKLEAWILNQRCEVSQMSEHCSGSAMECGLISL